MYIRWIMFEFSNFTEVKHFKYCSNVTEAKHFKYWATKKFVQGSGFIRGVSKLLRTFDIKKNAHYALDGGSGILSGHLDEKFLGAEQVPRGGTRQRS